MSKREQVVWLCSVDETESIVLESMRDVQDWLSEHLRDLALNKHLSIVTVLKYQKERD